MAQPDNMSLENQASIISITNLTPITIPNQPWFPYEITQNMDDFIIAPKVYQNDRDYFYPLYFRGFKCKIQTPVMQLMFGVQQYKNPGSDIQKYSLHLSLRSGDSETKQFKTLLREIDTYAKINSTLPPETYFSAIRHNYANPDLHPVLRVKIPSQDDTDVLLCDIYTEHHVINEPTYAEAAELLKHKTYVRCILELSNIWVAGNKFGVSYKLIQLQVIPQNAGQPMFRENIP